ncbi:hypothetical protein F4780DRAFT_775562 [Xylariomycetidae sp. FL0641]|nr:hypothetical protein F4780DRAFT_775562 [Xylariomycetidae sp. FL0641]
MANTKSYISDIDDLKLNDQKFCLSQAKFPDGLDQASRQMGALLADKERNELPPAITNIQCEGIEPLTIHFMRLRSKMTGTIPPSLRTRRRLWAAASAARWRTCTRQTARRHTHLNYDHDWPPSRATDPLLALQHVVTRYAAREQHGLTRSAQFETKGRDYQAEKITKP